MSRPRKKTKLTLAQVVTLRGRGVDWKRIENISGISRWTWQRLLRNKKDGAKPVLHHRAACATPLPPL
jgi:hypothetical protein